MSSNELLLMLAALILGTQLCRFLPTLLPKKVLSSPILQKLNKMLPLVIMVLLILTSLTLPTQQGNLTPFISQLLALVCVILSYLWLNNTLLSVALGILSFNGFLWLFG